MIYTHLAAALIAGALAAGGAWRVQDWRYGAKEAARLEEVARDRMRAEKNIDVAATGYEKDKARIRTEFITITEEVERVIEKPVYRDVCLDADGLRVLSDAIRGPAPASSQPARTLSRPGSPD